MFRGNGFSDNRGIDFFEESGCSENYLFLRNEFFYQTLSKVNSNSDPNQFSLISSFNRVFDISIFRKIGVSTNSNSDPDKYLIVFSGILVVIVVRRRRDRDDSRGAYTAGGSAFATTRDDYKPIVRGDFSSSASSTPSGTEV